MGHATWGDSGELLWMWSHSGECRHSCVLVSIGVPTWLLGNGKLFSRACASRPRRPSTDVAKGVKCFPWSRHRRMYFLLFSLSCMYRTFSSGCFIYVFSYVSVTMISIMVSIWRCYIWHISISPQRPSTGSEVELVVTSRCFCTFLSLFEEMFGSLQT